jgi:phosphoribosylglycinamide formyltransferase-1
VIRLAAFASGNGSNLQALIDASIAKLIDVKIELVISNNSAAGALERAQRAGIEACHISQKKYSNEDEYISAIESALRQHAIDLIVLAGYLKLLPSPIVKKYYGRIINIHPALLPKYGGPGMYGLNVHQAVLASKDRYSGATVHIVDDKYDHGPILIQRHVPVLGEDTPETLAARVRKIEHEILPMAVSLYIK